MNLIPELAVWLLMLFHPLEPPRWEDFYPPEPTPIIIITPTEIPDSCATGHVQAEDGTCVPDSYYGPVIGHSHDSPRAPWQGLR